MADILDEFRPANELEMSAISYFETAIKSMAAEISKLKESEYALTRALMRQDQQIEKLLLRTEMIEGSVSK